MSSTHWDEYWSGSAKSTISEYDKQEYGEQLTNKWQSVVEMYASGGSLVDLACGNGDLALTAYSTLQKKKLNNSIYAVDYSSIKLTEDIQGKAALDYITWLPNTKAEALPIEDSSISLVLSQFGFEYTNIEQSIPELARVIKFGGNISFLIHHDKSFISTQSSIEWSCYEALLFEEGLFETAKSLIKSAAIEKGTIESERLRHDLNQKLSRLHSEYEGCFPILAFVNLLKSKLANLSQIEKSDFWAKFDELECSFKAHHKRLAHMISSIYSKNKMQQLEELFISNGFKKLEMTVYNTSVGILGWWLDMERC